MRLSKSQSLGFLEIKSRQRFLFKKFPLTCPTDIKNIELDLNPALPCTKTVKMDDIQRRLRNYFQINPPANVIELLRNENDNRRLMGHDDILVIPPQIGDEEVNIYDDNMWNVAGLAGLLRVAGVRVREAGHPLPLLGLLLRLRQVVEDTAPSHAYEPSPFGKNKWSYWFPILQELFSGLAITLGTIFAVQVLYHWSEEYHHRYNCTYSSEFYTLKCYVLKKSRSYLEELNYNLVYTVLCGLGIAFANTLRKYQSSATARFK